MKTEEQIKGIESNTHYELPYGYWKQEEDLTQWVWRIVYPLF